MHIYFDVGSTMINSLPFNCDKNDLKIFFLSFKTIMYTEKVCNTLYIKIADRNVWKIHILRSYAQFATGCK